jgi:hypothetical protein
MACVVVPSLSSRAKTRNPELSTVLCKDLLYILDPGSRLKAGMTQKKFKLHRAESIAPLE